MKSRFISRAQLFGVSSLFLVAAFGAVSSRADGYDDLWMECHYITQCSASSANATIHFAADRPAYGIFNDWRIGNGVPDFVQPGEASIGAIGLLYGYQRLVANGRSNSELDWRAKAALSGFFWSWLRNPANRNGYGYPVNISYNSAGNVTSRGPGDARVTAELLIAMRKYCLLSPNGDRASYQSQEYSRAHGMADFVNANLSSWTIDRSYAVAAFHGFANWAAAVGDSATSTYFHNRANTISSWIANAQDLGSWGNYYDYLDGGGRGVYNGGISQVGFAPYEFNGRWAGEAFAKKLSDWWNYGRAYNNNYLTVQSGTYAGGVHQWTPQNGTDSKVYPGSSLQLADALWKIASATGNYNNTFGSAWWHYNFAKSGSGCWITNWNADPGYIGGFVDWVDTSNNARPATWQRFVDTSGYFIIATEELVFSSAVDFAF
jgi:hypothetical protein